MKDVTRLQNHEQNHDKGHEVHQILCVMGEEKKDGSRHAPFFTNLLVVWQIHRKGQEYGHEHTTGERENRNGWSTAWVSGL